MLRSGRSCLCLVLAALCLFSGLSLGAETSMYAKAESWAFLPEDSTKPADVFFVTPTVYFGDDSHYNMSMDDGDTKANFLGAAYMEKGLYDCCNFYAPYYSQASLSAYELTPEQREEYLLTAYGDIRQAFQYYMQNYNQGRPLILAGFSQGADLALRLLEEYFSDAQYQDKLIAAYVIGWAVTEEDLSKYPHLKMAQCATDLGRIVSFNSESESVTSSVIVPGTTLGINPLNWRTDSTPAEAEENKGACFTDYSGQITKELPGLCGAYLAPGRGTLKVTGVTPEEYPAGLSIFQDGVYHLYDYQFFYRNLQENVEDRVEQYLTLEFIGREYKSDAPESAPAETEEAKRAAAYIATADRVTPDMLSADYWIARTAEPEELIMTAEEIAAFNAGSKEPFYTYAAPGFSGVLTGEELRGLVSESGQPEYDCYLDGVKREQDYWDALLAQRDLESIQDSNQLRYGICLERTALRVLPTDDVLSESPEFTFYDEMQQSSILINEPVLVLWDSADGQWLYVQTCYCGGWIHREEIALCSGYEQWRAAQDFDAFLVVTGDKIRLEYDPLNSRCSELELSMGVRLELVGKNEYAGTQEGRRAADNYLVRIPADDGQGNYKTEYAYVPLSAEVSLGYLPYTRANQLELAFGCLGIRYGWGGMYNARDCSQYMMEMFRCFGLSIPRNSYGQELMDCHSLDMAGMSDGEKQQLLGAVPPGAMLLFPGHVMMYLGQVDGCYYVISAAATSVPSTGTAVNYQSVMVNDLSAQRRSGKTWLQSLETVKLLYQPEAA